MRSTIIAAAFAAGALAVPFQKRATITDYEVVYVTQVVTVTAGATKPTSHHYGHSVSSSSTHAAAPVATSKTSSSRKSSSTKAAAPVKTSSKSSTHAAAPASSSSSSTRKSSTHAAAPVSTSKSSTRAAAPLSTSTSIGKSSTHAAAPVSTSKSSTRAAAPVSSSTKSSTKSTAAATSAQSAAPTSYQDIAVFHHNLHRSNHSAPNIAWSASLAATASKIAQSCVYAHNVAQDGGGYGQNIAAGVKADNISAIITDLFYNGEEEWFANLYGQAQPDMTNFEHWGHFSQIVWKGSKTVGCATQDCSAQGLQGVGSDVAPFFTVCNYEAPGNYANEYAANIGSPLGRATARWNTGLSK